MRGSQPPLNVCLHSGLFVRHDAVSDSLRHKLDILTKLHDDGHPIDVSVFTTHSDQSDRRIHQARSVGELVATSEFWDADIHVFEVGMYYSLFESIFLIPEDRRIMGVYHNLTPLELLDTDHNIEGTERSLVQLQNLWEAHHVASDSEFNRDELVAMGFPPPRLSVLHLPPSLTVSAEGRPYLWEEASDEEIPLLFVGRLVRAKGIIDLLEALRELSKRHAPAVSLTIVGKTLFAESPVLEAIEAARQDIRVELRQDASRAELSRLYRSSAALVIPSYHEGYCVPVVEALSAGCYVIAANGGNLPNVVGGLGPVVDAGDVTGLGRAMEVFLTSVRAARARQREAELWTAQGEIGESDWRRRVRSHLEEYSPETYRRRFLGVLRDLAEGLPDGAPAWLDAAVDHRDERAIA